MSCEEKKEPMASEISSTDAAIFRKLANPDVVNVNFDASRCEKKSSDEQPTKPEVVKEEAEPSGGGGVKRSFDDMTEDSVTKQSLLLELQELEAKGVRLSRKFTLSDSIGDLELELHTHVSNMNTKTTVGFMRDALKLIISGLEVGNARLGPFLDIQGWAANVTSDMSRYEPVLERIYKRYCRRQQMNPLVELGWLLIGSMLTWHFNNTLLAPLRPRPAPAAGSGSRPRAAARQPMGRKILRPPSPLFSNLMSGS